MTSTLTCTVTGRAPDAPALCSCVGCTAAHARLKPTITNSEIQEAVQRGLDDADRIRKSGGFGAGRATITRYR